MPKVTIDGRQIEVEPGATVLEAARALGIHIPTLCHHKGFKPFTSCMVCVVRDLGMNKLRPACSARAEDGMAIEASSEEVLTARRHAIELLLSEHVGDCEAPCTKACPANMNIPRMIRELGKGDHRAALHTILRDIPLPAVLGRICPAPCEKACRRGRIDAPLRICLLKRFAADAGCADGTRSDGPPDDDTGKRVAVVGAGPAGLAAAYYLRLRGNACDLFDNRAEPGGELRGSVPASRLPHDVLDAECDAVLSLGVNFIPRKTLGQGLQLDVLRDTYHAVVIATGVATEESATDWDLEWTGKGIKVDPHTCETAKPGVFAVGAAVFGARKMAVRATADGKKVAAAIGWYLSEGRAAPAPKRFNSVITAISAAEYEQFLDGAAEGPGGEPAGGEDLGYSPSEAQNEAERCLHCDCRKPESCGLRRFANDVGASQQKYKGDERKPVRIIRQHARVVYEPGKCIRCGLCVRITERECEPLGLAFVGRGFDVEVGVPFGEGIDKALVKSAAECVAECPTGALAFVDLEE